MSLSFSLVTYVCISYQTLVVSFLLKTKLCESSLNLVMHDDNKKLDAHKTPSKDFSAGGKGLYCTILWARIRLTSFSTIA